MSCIKRENRGNRICAELDGDIYHEKQSWELCALHALNNLFQDGKAFTKHQLDKICYSLSPSSYVNPHKSMFGLGNYDVNVIMAALQTKNCDTIWFDKRKNTDDLVMERIDGFILNVPTDYKWGIFHLPVHRRHWITVRKVGDHFYNLDSKIDAPEIIGGEKEIHNYLREQIECKEKELLIVVTQEVAREGTWIRTNQNEKATHKFENFDGHSTNKTILIEESSEKVANLRLDDFKNEDSCLKIDHV